MTEADIENMIGQFDAEKTYVLTGKELNAIKLAIKRTNPVGPGTKDTGPGGTEILSSGYPQPGFMCISGQTVAVTFMLQEAPPV